MAKTHLEYILGQWCVVNDDTGEKKGQARPKERETSREGSEFEEEKHPLCSRLYLENFVLNTDNRTVYPYKLISSLGLRQIDFAPITILYGGNGCGKSTLLNVIADKIGVKKKTAGNTNAYFADYVETCGYQTVANQVIPDDSTFIRSEDIMDGIMKGRRRYSSAKKVAMGDSRMIPEPNGRAAEIVNNLMNHPDALSARDRFFLSRCKYAGAATFADDIADMFESNGEVALKRLQSMIMPDSLYFIDEPEVSLSPIFQQELASHIETFARSLRTQFVIATHSPFFLSMSDARIYDLDSHPVKIRKWYELPNMHAYFLLFEQYREKFER